LCRCAECTPRPVQACWHPGPAPCQQTLHERAYACVPCVPCVEVGWQGSPGRGPRVWPMPYACSGVRVPCIV
jgi:hypothetical protein